MTTDVCSVYATAEQSASPIDLPRADWQLAFNISMRTAKDFDKRNFSMLWKFGLQNIEQKMQDERNKCPQNHLIKSNSIFKIYSLNYLK